MALPNCATSTRKLPKKYREGGEAIPQFTMADVAKHNKHDDCWIILDGYAYDMTRFVDRHPGGVGPVLNMAGKDASDVFDNYHAARVYEHMLTQYFVGEVTDVIVYPHVAEFRAIRQEMLKNGWFKTSNDYYRKLFTWFFVLFVVGISFSTGLVGGGGNFARLFGAFCIGIFWQQVAGFGHDLGHSSYTHDFHYDHKFGSILTMLMGLSLCWWKSDHNTHHVVCNSVEHDPNIQHMPILAITDKIYQKPFYDTYHKKLIGMDLLARTLVSYQHWFFYPVMAVGRANLHLQSIMYLVLSPDIAHYRYTELASITVYFIWMLTLAFSMPTGAMTAAWIGVSHATSGLLHVQIVLSHWAMMSYMGSPYTSEDTEWYMMQFKTTMNVDCHPWLDWLHIGLQFQLEHHLYPRLPRHRLRDARNLVKAAALKHNIPYHEPNFFQGNYEMWDALRTAAMGARKTKKGDGGFYQSAIWDGLNCSG